MANGRDRKINSPLGGKRENVMIFTTFITVYWNELLMRSKKTALVVKKKLLLLLEQKINYLGRWLPQKWRKLKIVTTKKI